MTGADLRQGPASLPGLVFLALGLLPLGSCGAPHPQARRPRFLPPAEYLEPKSLADLPDMGEVGAQLFHRAALLYPADAGFSVDVQHLYEGWLPAIPFTLLTLEGPAKRMVFMDDNATPRGCLRIDGHWFQGPLLLVDREWRVHRISLGAVEELESWYVRRFMEATEPGRRESVRLRLDLL